MNAMLRENIDWVGHVDWTVRDFHSYDAERGVTYNAYLVRDEQTALIDAVREPYGEELLKNVAALCDLASVEYVVCNHAELDHAGALPEVMRALPNASLVCDKKCAEALALHFDMSGWKQRIVKSGEEISLGRRTLRFLETPMVHWPESMFTYVPEEKLLFSMDGFGQHYASAERFDDEVPLPAVMDEAKTYYANIVMPYGKSVKACLEHLAGWPIEMIAPSHGVIWRTHLDQIVAAYRDWADCRAKPKVLVVFDSMWESTARMAEAILDGAGLPGVERKLIHLRRTSLTQLAGEVIDAAAIAFGSATLNSGMMPAASAALTYLEGLKAKGKAGFAFGSYGWGRGGTEAVDQRLHDMGWEILREPLRAKYRPTEEVLAQCREAGRVLGERALGGMMKAE
jgi:flavorubredoxin